MFTLELIKVAYDKVKTGADFPNYIQELIDMGIEGYDTYTADSRVVYFGANNYDASTDRKHTDFPVASTVNKERFIEYLVMHQGGQTDYITFCEQAAQCGIAKWRIDIIGMTCTYFSADGEAIIIEKLPV
jgi:uncharacterized protein YbcV (DUF1398 family)